MNMSEQGYSALADAICVRAGVDPTAGVKPPSMSEIRRDVRDVKRLRLVLTTIVGFEILLIATFVWLTWGTEPDAFVQLSIAGACFVPLLLIVHVGGRYYEDREYVTRKAAGRSLDPASRKEWWKTIKTL